MRSCANYSPTHSPPPLNTSALRSQQISPHFFFTHVFIKGLPVQPSGSLRSDTDEVTIFKCWIWGILAVWRPPIPSIADPWASKCGKQICQGVPSGFSVELGAKWGIGVKGWSSSTPSAVRCWPKEEPCVTRKSGCGSGQGRGKALPFCQTAWALCHLEPPRTGSRAFTRQVLKNYQNKHLLLVETDNSWPLCNPSSTIYVGDVGMSFRWI